MNKPHTCANCRHLYELWPSPVEDTGFDEFVVVTEPEISFTVCPSCGFSEELKKEKKK